MTLSKKVPGPIAVLMLVIVLSAAATWLIPAGEYNKLSMADASHFSVSTTTGPVLLPLAQQTLDSLNIRIPLEKFTSQAIRKPVSVPGSYHPLPKNGQGIFSILQAPIKGIYDTIDIILFILIIGGFMQVFHESGALVRGIEHLSRRMRGRVLMFVLSTAISIWYIVRYAQKVKKDPTASIVYQVDGVVTPLYDVATDSAAPQGSLDWRTRGLLLVFASTFLGMIGGVIFLGWWLLEMSTLFLGASLLLAVLLRLPEKKFTEQFIKGAEGLLSVAFIVGIARGVTVVLNDGRISDSILYYSAQWVGNMPPALFVVMLLCLFMLFTLFIASSSGMAVLTMPIIGALAMVVHVPGESIVNAYLFGMGIMGFMTPTGLMLPSLALVNVSIAAWWRFIRPLLLMLFALCSVFLVWSVVF